MPIMVSSKKGLMGAHLFIENFCILVEETNDTDEDREARALLNKFLGASVLMSGMESMVSSSVKEEFTGGAAPGAQKVSQKYVVNDSI